MTPRPVLVVAGVGNGAGTGAATARAFSKAGYSIALIARGRDALQTLADVITAEGGTAAAFPVATYSSTDIAAAFASVAVRFPAPDHALRAALFNATHNVWKPFLDITPEDVAATLAVDVAGAFAFAREAIVRFKENGVDAVGARGTLLFTGATASLRGNTTTSLFAAGKFGVRALSQSLAKEFGKDNIHVAHAIIDGIIYNERHRARRPEWEQQPDVRLTPEAIADAYLFLTQQERSAWTWELDLRPAHERW